MMNKHIFLLFMWMTLGSASASAQLSLGYYKFKDGAEYTGELKGRRPNGKGRTVFRNGDVYEGQYVKGKRREKVLIYLLTGRNTLENGIKISNMEKVLITL